MTLPVTAKQFLAPLEALVGENEAVVGSNNTTINKYFNAQGAAYCLYSFWYCDRKTGAGVFDGCSNPAYVPTFKSFCKSRYGVVPNNQAQEGDLAAYLNQHGFAIKKRISGTTVITLEGNSRVWATIAEAEANPAGTGAYEGIGYKKRVLDLNYTVYHLPFKGSSGGSTPAPAPAQRTPDKAKVKDWQTWLNVKADGEPGPDTELATLRMMLLAMLTRQPLGPGAPADAVKAFQGMLYAAGYDPKGLDGSYGPGCTAAVKAFEADHGQDQDGGAGVKVVSALIDEVF